ncbi:hypothetical protein GLAREA_11421 [Glarea lozoyensis ATCC 20868]|uniref:DUF1772-domain-containing protein n=1 Tax=Glarea lozoyensis (strain ATCC 20868 / MF5171) TaxID=1116229 RepID=S3CG18_GLAL2|nr:uncharacterized protein GLAREA_11421 [Glarea lozoyensis ATCC 20868]EPE24840.1 hypothetical protein GLAREA_11421 [Glarea lozoyensis ATCC 20868]
MSTSTTTTTTLLQTLTISTSLLASGAIASLSLLTIPLLTALPASRSLPATRWLFSRGSHIFPQAASISSAGFAYLAYTCIPSHTFHLVDVFSYGREVNGYLLAAALTLSIGPFTGVMIPTNFELIGRNEGRGGKRSEGSAREGGGVGKRKRSAEASVAGTGEGSEFTDLSGPQEKVEGGTEEEDERVVVLLRRFQVLNFVRAALIGAGGVVGLVVALS